MNDLKHAFRQQWDQLHRPSATATVLEVREGDLRLRIELEQLDKLGCAMTLWSLTRGHVTSGSGSVSAASLRPHAEQLCERLQYLLEPLQLIEDDPASGHCQVRSMPPTIGPDKTRTYFELAVSPNSISLCRYQSVPGEPRRAIAAMLTSETLTRLTLDLIDLLPGSAC